MLKRILHKELCLFYPLESFLNAFRMVFKEHYHRHYQKHHAVLVHQRPFNRERLKLQTIAFKSHVKGLFNGNTMFFLHSF